MRDGQVPQFIVLGHAGRPAGRTTGAVVELGQAFSAKCGHSAKLRLAERRHNG